MALQYVGGTSGSGTTDYSISLNGTLTGGIGSSPQPNDIVILVYNVIATSSISASLTTPTGFTKIIAASPSTSTRIPNTWIGYKIMRATPDTSVTVPASGNSAYGGSAVVHVWRGASTLYPFWKPSAFTNGVGTSYANAPAITPLIEGSVILACGGATGDSTPTAMTGPSGMSNFVTRIGTGSTTSAIVGISSYAWSSGSYDPPAWSGGESTASDGFTGASLVLNPPAPTRYWVGNGGQWNDSAHWSATSGGAGGAGIPGEDGKAIFDANSFTSTGQTITVPLIVRCGGVDFTNVTNSPTIDCTGGELRVCDGDLKFATGMTLTNVDVTIKSSLVNNTQSLVTAGKSFISLAIYQISDDLTGNVLNITGDVNLTSTDWGFLCYYSGGTGAYTINTNNYNITSANNICANSDYTLNLGTSTLTAGGDIDLDYDSYNLNNLNASNASIVSTSTNIANYIWFSSTHEIGSLTINGSIKVYASNFVATSFTALAGANFTLAPSNTGVIRVTNLTLNGSSGSPITIARDGSSAVGFSKSSGVVSASYLVLTNIIGTGGASFYAGTTSTDNGGNTGWIFTHTVALTSDSLKRKQNVVSHTTDALKHKVSTVYHNTDASFGKAKTHTTDAEIRGPEPETLDSPWLKKLKIGKAYGPITSVVLGRVPQNDNVVIASSAPKATTISNIDLDTNIFTVTGHGMSDGSLVRITSTGTLPSPLLSDKNYFIYTNSDSDTFALARDYENAIAGTNLINITTAGSGTITLSHIRTQEVQINNNQLVDDDRQTLLPELYPSLVGIEWNEVDAETVGLGWHEVGDVVRFRQGSTVVNGFISEIHMTFDGSFKERLVAVIPDVATINYQTAGGVIKTLYNTEIKVDKQNNDITSIVSQQDAYETQTLENFTEIYQNLENILLTIQKTGGGNILLNSVGFAKESTTDYNSNSYDKLQYWDYNANYSQSTHGTVTSFSSSESQNAGGLSGQTIKMIGTNVLITQRVEVAANTPISFAVRVNNPLANGSATITISNTNDSNVITIDDAEIYDWEEIKLENFVSTMSWLNVTIQVSNTTNFMFTDLRLMYGSTIQSWAQAPTELLSANVQFTKDGMKIFDGTHDTETQVTYNEFSTRRRSDGVVLFEADDSGIVTNDLSIKGATEYRDGSGVVIRQITIPDSSSLAGIAFIKVL